MVDESSIRNATVSKPMYQLLLAMVLAGDWSSHKSLEVAYLWPFCGIRGRLAIIQHFETYTFEQGSVHLVIPEAL